MYYSVLNRNVPVTDGAKAFTGRKIKDKST